MLYGYDVSHWNTHTPNDMDFLIVKASEGETYHDPAFNRHLNAVRMHQIDLVGAYHYAKTNTDVEKNVDNFIKAISSRPEFKKSMILALDIEGEDIRRQNAWEWVLKWCQLVYERTKIRPVVYTSASYTSKMKSLYDNNFGLWVAHWGVNKPSIKVYPFYTLWQYSNGNGKLDADVFNGTREQYLKYCVEV